MDPPRHNAGLRTTAGQRRTRQLRIPAERPTRRAPQLPTRRAPPRAPLTSRVHALTRAVAGQLQKQVTSRRKHYGYGEGKNDGYEEDRVIPVGSEGGTHVLGWGASVT